ncbi:hypothetical protein [Rugamonas rubra]|uniref:Uncharacterized protein n=1 Tax=Rugamonas rubra TaxID=758825 RepID=A0A1I4QDW9_9BURK|nr:hypothetical protein [Rugamonas rubra]SFM38249.1 hypothetical protein SAMN02982985_03862 [Rugamonas rubra]
MNIKRILPVAIIAVLAIAAWHSMAGQEMHINIDGDEVDGPLGFLIGTLFAGGGLLIAALALTCAAVFVGFLFAGLGILMVVGLALMAVVLLACISPFLLPLLIPLGLFWFFSSRSRKQRSKQYAV